MRKLVISSASFYFWMNKFCPVEAILLTHKNLVKKFNGIDIYIDEYTDTGIAIEIDTNIHEATQSVIWVWGCLEWDEDKQRQAKRSKNKQY